jgi:hypothetical protein
VSQKKELKWACPHCDATEKFTLSGWANAWWNFNGFDEEGHPIIADWNLAETGEAQPDEEDQYRCHQCDRFFSHPKAVGNRERKSHDHPQI